MTIWNLVRRRSFQAKKRPLPAARQSWRPLLEVLEDRVTPTSAGFLVSPPSIVTGIVFTDTNNNGLHDVGESVVPGATVNLSGTSSQGTPVNISTTTDANGQYIFFQVQPGTYSITRGNVNNFINGQASFGNLGGTVANGAISQITVGEGQAAVEYDLAVRGLATGMVSLRDFLSTTTPQSENASFLPAPGAGQVAVDGSVQPSTPAVPGGSSLSGTVVDANGHGIQFAEVALTGIDITGLAVYQATMTDVNGAYSFGGLQQGTYTLNVLDQPTNDLRAGQPVVGSQGGQIFQSGQITDIQLPANTAGTSNNFSELPLPQLGTANGLTINAGLADDTTGPGGTTSDTITSDPAIQGSIATSSPVVSFQAGLDATPPSGFASILGSLTGSGAFFLNPALLALLAGGSLADGGHVLHLQATNAQGQTTSANVPFTLQSRAVTQPTAHLDSASDPSGSGFTTNATVTLQGQTSPGVQVQLKTATATLATTTADASGKYSFSGVALDPGTNNFTVQATDNAGNTSQLSTYFVKEQPPTTVPTTPVSESLTHGGSDQFVDLSSPTIFSAQDLSNSIVQFNTNAGPIYVQLDDATAPQTVANFFDYIKQGAYNNDIFHRLAQAFVLQGGGFTFNAGPDTITSTVQGPNVPNEFDGTNRPNVEGTIAMAKLGSDPNSATNQFFFNLVDNTQTLGSTNNGGFTVFGTILSGADQRVINTLAAANVVDESAYNSAFNTLPLNNYHGTNFPTDTTAANYDIISSVNILKQPDQLTYTVVSNSDTTGTIVNASISFGQLDLHPVGTGTATVVVKATDKAGNSTTVSFNVTVA